MLPLSIPRESGLENYFAVYRNNIVGHQQYFDSPFGQKKIIYADWTATGRAYGPIEKYIQQHILPFVGNTHTTTTITGTLMSAAYEAAKQIVKAHVNASEEDVLLFCGSGMTSAVNKLQRILGMRMPEHLVDYIDFTRCDEAEKPVIFVTHMEHHSNQLSWLETIANVEIIGCDENGNVDIAHLSALLAHFKHRSNKIAAVTACSNVTGIHTPYHDIAQLMHQYGGVCFVDFACAAPYCDINMHPAEPDTHLDAVYFSMHKFLGGPGTPGVLIFNKQLYRNAVPDHPGGGTVSYSNPWKVHEYVADIEQREDGGTPPFLQGIKAAMCIRLKEKMGVANILQREEELLEIIFSRLSNMKQVAVLEAAVIKRLGVISFIVTGAPYNLIVKLLNDRFGIQMRGGCSCAGTYGHMLLQVDKPRSYAILEAIRAGDLSCKPGWVRLSIHPVMTNAEVIFIMDAIEMTVSNVVEWGKDYTYDRHTNEYSFKRRIEKEPQQVAEWFDVEEWYNLINLPPL
ncbi:aminotransferase class V-fold PLP-dependent enzyme [Chitinophaga sp.]|uniref:aminotransferase class V-fold PLP-dependent enzyme n=1 Tax=Chitinophaga sp. TaxID=1869181 RepID=UPI002F92FB41